ncbi:MAG TPA: thioredoxin family protein [Gemmatimonadales bacterium]|jgi:predicted dithiol-disulfide oxidoreductase (DUF899 family)|nr:thioredoxin family protein [Gemmatimonadales bacterium]
MTSVSSSTIEDHPVVPHQEWLSARTALLAKEKEFTRLRDELSRERRELPWERVEKEYRFEGPGGTETLADLFAGRSQLVVYHFMFAPDWEAGCPACSFWADNFNGIDVHLKHRDTSFLAISHAPLVKLEAYKRRMGWSFKWVSSANTDFNFDYQVSFRPEEVARKKGFYNFAVTDPLSPEREGVSVFYKDATGTVYHTYSAYARGIDLLNGAYNYLDLTPQGRDEAGRGMFWLQRHDEYTP